MKFIVSAHALLKYLQMIYGVVGTNASLPILEDFLFRISGNGHLTALATDLETSLKITIPVEAKASGEVCIPAKVLMETLKNLPDQPLTFHINPDSGVVEMISDNGRYKLMGEKAENFPREPKPDGVSEEGGSPQQQFSLIGDVLLSAIQKGIFAISTNDMRPAMTGMLFEISPEEATFVATDSHRLVKYVRKSIAGEGAEQPIAVSQPTSFIVPRKPLNLLKGLISDQAVVQVSLSKSHMFLQTHEPAQLEIACRLIDARFPDYRVVIPTDSPYHLIISRTDLQQALRRISVFANKTNNQVIFTIQGSTLELSAQDIDYSFEGNERLNCQYEGEDMRIAFNARFLLEMLNVIDTDEVRFDLSTPSRAGIIRPAEQSDTEDLLMLIMPLMIAEPVS
ncbi:MAG: DNA polymerase III subunit beta [Thermoflavifilum sp.]|nr:DNA polymerase III subunit beta [Thermoflavifilum sp.]